MKDQIRTEHITICHCSTLQMIGDFITKPLQGSLFRKFWDAILGYKHMDTLAVNPTAPLEERVENINGQSAHGAVDGANAHGKKTTVQKTASCICHMGHACYVVRCVVSKDDTKLKKNRNKNKLLRGIFSKQSRSKETRFDGPVFGFYWQSQQEAERDVEPPKCGSRI